MSTQSMDVNTTKYLYKPNVETTLYFVNDGGEDIAAQVVRNTANIEINSTKIDALTTVVENNSSDISSLKTRMTTAETNISNSRPRNFAPLCNFCIEKTIVLYFALVQVNGFNEFSYCFYDCNRFLTYHFTYF